MLKLNDMTFEEYLEVKENLLENISQNLELCNEVQTVVLSDGNVELKLNHLLINLFLLTPYKYFNEEIKISDVVNCEGMTNHGFNKHMQVLLDRFYTIERKLQINDILARIVEDMNYLTLLFNKYRGLTIDVFSIAQLANRNEEFDKIIHTKVDEENYSMQENEQYIEKQYKKMVDLVTSDGNDMCFTPFLKCGEGLNGKQLKQYAVNIGSKPTINGTVHPKSINCNLLTGLEVPSNYLVDAMGSRKAVIINSTEVKDSGYMARRLTLATINTILDKSVETCNSVNFLKIDLTEKSEKEAENILKRLQLRFAKVNDKDVEITKDNYKDFIGQVIYLYSPITCACKTGVCKKCYGKLSELNDDIHIGKLGVDILSSQLTQILLSSKHLLDTKSEKIEWNEDLLKILKVNGNIIIPSKEFTEEMNVQLLIDVEDIDLEDYVHNNRKDNTVFITKLTIVADGKKTAIDLPKELFPSSELIDYLNECNIEDDDDVYVVNLHELPSDQPLFYFTIENSELSAHLYRLQELIERKDHLGFNTIELLMEEINSVIFKSKLRITSVHIENLIRELIKDVNTKFRPDFSKVITDNDYEIYTLDNSILYSDSLVVGLAFEKVAKQLVDPTTYEKTASSYLDHIFK